LINSCNDNIACKATARDGAFDELIDCCNDDNSQCKDKDGLDIINAGCVSYVNVYLMLVKKSNDSLSLIYKHIDSLMHPVECRLILQAARVSPHMNPQAIRRVVVFPVWW